MWFLFKKYKKWKIASTTQPTFKYGIYILIFNVCLYVFSFSFYNLNIYLNLEYSLTAQVSSFPNPNPKVIVLAKSNQTLPTAYLHHKNSEDKNILKQLKKTLQSYHLDRA